MIGRVDKRRVDAIRAAYAAFDRGEWDSFVRQGYHEDAVWEASWDDISFATMRGRETFAETWEAFRSQQEWAEGPAFEVKRIEELERDRILVEALSRARGARSGIEVTRRSWHLYEYRGPKVARVQWFNTREEALAGLSLAPEGETTN
jgi:ketosteroid isomerase-like protein